MRFVGLLQIAGTDKGFFSYMIHEDTQQIVEMRAMNNSNEFLLCFNS